MDRVCTFDCRQSAAFRIYVPAACRQILLIIDVINIGHILQLPAELLLLLLFRFGLYRYILLAGRFRNAAETAAGVPIIMSVVSTTRKIIGNAHAE